jgi:hypothetical protein
MREGMVWYDVFAIIEPRYDIPTIPGSLFLQQPIHPSCLTRQPGGPAERVRVEPEPRPANLADRRERRVDVGDPLFPVVAVAVGKPMGKPGKTRAARRAAKAAIAAASIGK